MTDDEVLGLLRDALRAVGGDGVDALALDMDIDDAGLDSVRAMEVVGYLEERLDREFPDDRLARIKTFRDLARLIRER